MKKKSMKVKKQKSPMELDTGEELYEYLKDKSPREVEDYFVSRGARIVNGIMLNNGLEVMYLIEKESREKNDAGKTVSAFDGSVDGLSR